MDKQTRQEKDPVRLFNLLERQGRRPLPRLGAKYLVWGRKLSRACTNENCPIVIVSARSYLQFETSYYSYQCDHGYAGDSHITEWKDWSRVERIR